MSGPIVEQPALPSTAEPVVAVRKQSAKPSRTLLNFWIDAALLLAVVSMIWISVMLQLVFPPPTIADGWQLWGRSYDEWRDLQFFALCVSALLALEHLVLHWNWVCTVLATRVLRLRQRPDEGVQAIYGVATFIGILFFIFGSIVAARLSIQKPGP